MRSVAFVVGKEARQGGDPFRSRGVGPLVGPAVLDDLHEGLRLAVGPRPVGPRAQVPDATAGGGVPEGVREVGAAVVGEQALHLDPVAGEEGQALSSPSAIVAEAGA